MKKTNRRALILSVISICTVALLLASLSIFNALAAADDKYVAEVGSTKYEKYEEAHSDEQPKKPIGRKKNNE